MCRYGIDTATWFEWILPPTCCADSATPSQNCRFFSFWPPLPPGSLLASALPLLAPAQRPPPSFPPRPGPTRPAGPHPPCPLFPPCQRTNDFAEARIIDHAGATTPTGAPRPAESSTSSTKAQIRAEAVMMTPAAPSLTIVTPHISPLSRPPCPIILLAASPSPTLSPPSSLRILTPPTTITRAPHCLPPPAPALQPPRNLHHPQAPPPFPTHRSIFLHQTIRPRK